MAPEDRPASRPWLLLPGMDGTGELFEPLRRALPDAQALEIVRYPRDQRLGYGELLALTRRASLPPGAVLIGESFSGPVAIRLAAERRDLAALVLVSSFCTSPLTPLVGFPARLFGALPFRVPPPRFALRRMLLGADAPAALVDEVRTAIRSVSPRVFAHRLTQLVEVDVREELGRVTCPILYLQGSRDALVPARAGSEVLELGRDVELVSVDAPHLVLQCAPDAAARAIADFLERRT